MQLEGLGTSLTMRLKNPPCCFVALEEMLLLLN